jgi:hypothetical protein
MKMDTGSAVALSFVRRTVLCVSFFGLAHALVLLKERIYKLGQRRTWQKLVAKKKPV